MWSCGRRLFASLLDLAMRHRNLVPYRKRAVPAARGAVLEIGVGSGLNLPLYGPGAKRICAIDPSAELLRLARGRRAAPADIVLMQASAEMLPFKSAIFDTVVITWTLCSIPDPGRALKEMRRVLKPDGQLLFVEHGLAPDRIPAYCQNLLTPVWKRISGGCHLNRGMDALMRAAGFRIETLQTGYIRGRNPFTFMYEGIARPTQVDAGLEA